MSEHEIALINDGEGIALLGDAGAIDRFLAEEGIPSQDLGLARLGSAASLGAMAAETGSQIASTSGRWIKLTEHSAKALAQGTTMKGSTDDVARAILVNPDTKRTKMILEFVKTPGASLTNPAMLSGAAGLMAQLAMKQTMDQITDYLEQIDAKLDDVLRNQKDAVVAGLIGVGLVIDEAITVQQTVGRVSEVTWSKVQGSQATIFATQGYAVRQIEGLTEKLERAKRVGTMVDVARELRAGISDWLAILARCFQLQDALGVLELDRVLDAAPDELDRHRLGLRKAREDRMELIGRTTTRLLERVDAAANTANREVLLNPFESPDLFRSSTEIAGAVVEFNSYLGIEATRENLDARRWREAAGEKANRALEAGAQGASNAGRFGREAASRVRSGTGKLSTGLGESAQRARDRIRRDVEDE